MNHRTLALLGALSTLAAASTAFAQRTAGITFDATVGKGTGRTDGIYRDNRSGLTADAVLAARVGSMLRGSLVVGVNASAHGSGAYDTVCLPSPDGGCIPAFPNFEIIGALLGWQDNSGAVRATTGAAYVQAEWDGWSVGWQGRVDFALPLASHVAAVASLRGTMIPNYPRGDAFRLFAFGFGVRIL